MNSEFSYGIKIVIFELFNLYEHFISAIVIIFIIFVNIYWFFFCKASYNS